MNKQYWNLRIDEKMKKISSVIDEANQMLEHINESKRVAIKIIDIKEVEKANKENE